MKFWKALILGGSKILKNLDLNFRHDRNFDLDRNFGRNLTFLHIQKYDASRKRYVSSSFLGRIDVFSGELHFLEGDTKFSIFTKIWKQNALAAGLKPQTPKSSKIRASTRIHANFDLNQRNSAKLKAQNKRINHQNFHANGEIFEKRKKKQA